MATYARTEVIQTVLDQRLVPLFYHPDPELGKSVLKACYEGGARLMEFTNRGDFAQEVFSELSKYVGQELPGMVLGIGSINDAPTAAMYLQLGANFIVGASFREDIARVCNRRKVAYVPGCGTLTEIGTAEEMGCELVKLFPGSVYGPDFVKSIKGPSPWTRIMPTGGVSTDEENLRSWFDAGVSAVGMGSKMISKDIIAEKSWDELTQRVERTLKLIETMK
ncbi:bifunctional 4-hydroxy-2-oxoglutarate aldolase/2-dehydro-3-deoxy-phosphogluconate aldolase [Membranicola marinus]|uniref:Bifunctional 4-hydroxy-2-oxoglutarate aldolase/2-dehydro-3-deoxy-phosphogluconate aldolase n=1 Tax=Membranihabitans marinus TaxID=1227546 RepID=A0A953HK12_9BACT|nr:bifunctional 4-hydroxy-2-oxoglutarate aldolase/2-dehydro-3-deoxy-phosphogluconate aldolase [Membranihabitans marinus]MBY5957127.1 bifunctional 4-hydroxy-2-oxoglutarate aldolase/2-dehydro-3-deoxy-phosphogluconate aldolase [Membranihabitans marinus]